MSGEGFRRHIVGNPWRQFAVAILRRADQANDLRHAGYRAFEATDVIVALTVLAKHRIDLVITDVNLPEPLKVPVIKFIDYKGAGNNPRTASASVGLVERLLTPPST